MAGEKTAYAKAVAGCGAGGLYDVRYSNTIECDTNMPYHYLWRLVLMGYRVEVDRAGDVPAHVIQAPPIAIG